MTSGPDRPLRVVHIVTVAETLLFLRGHGAFMRANGVELIAIASPGPYGEEFSKAEGVDVIYVGMERAISPLKDLAALWHLARAIRRLRPHIVHAHTPKGGLLGMCAAFLAKAPGRIYHMRGLPLETLTGMRRILMTTTERVACALASRVIAVSPSLRRRAIELTLCAPEKIVTFLDGSGNGVDAAGRFRPDPSDAALRAQVRRQHDIPAEAFVVAFVGRLARDKGIAELMDAWTQVQKRHPGAHLLIAGEHDVRDGVSAETLRGAGVRLAGRVADSRPIYAAADLLAHPSHREGFPNAVLEAAAMGLPVVSTRATGCVDAVVDGETGMLIQVGDSPALSDAISRYILHPELRLKHGTAGRARTLERFNPERIWNCILTEYRAHVAQTA